MSAKNKSHKKLKTDKGAVNVLDDHSDNLEAMFERKHKQVDCNAAAQSFAGPAGRQPRSSVSGTVIRASKDITGQIYVTLLAESFNSAGAIDAVAGHILSSKKLNDAPPADVEDTPYALAQAANFNDKGGQKKAKPVTLDGMDDTAPNGPIPVAQRVQHTLVSFNFKWVDKAKELPCIGDKISVHNFSYAFGKEKVKNEEMYGPFINGSHEWKVQCLAKHAETDTTADRLDAVFDHALLYPAMSKSAAVVASSAFGCAVSVPHSSDDDSSSADAVRLLISHNERERATVIEGLNALKGKHNNARDHPNMKNMIDEMVAYASTAEVHEPFFPVSRGDSATLIQIGTLRSKVPTQIQYLLQDSKFSSMPPTFAALNFKSVDVTEKMFVKACGTVSIVCDKHDALRDLNGNNSGAIIDALSGRGDESLQCTVGVKLHAKHLADQFQCSDATALMSMVTRGLYATTNIGTYQIQPAPQGSIAGFAECFNRTWILNLRKSIETIGVPVTEQFVSDHLGRKGGNLNGRKKSQGLDPNFIEMERVSTITTDGISNLSEIQGTSVEDIKDEAAKIGKTLEFYVVDGESIGCLVGDQFAQQSPEAGDAFVKSIVMLPFEDLPGPDVFDETNAEHALAMRSYLGFGGTAIVYAIAH